jgi:uncharacterized protein (DUF433 family)
VTNELVNFDPRDIPVYSYADVAHYLALSKSTVRAWVKGTSITTPQKTRRQFRPVIEKPDPKSNLLSFTNLVELHVLSAIRWKYRVSLQKVREALIYIDREFPIPHPLANMEFKTDQVDLFIDALGKIFAVSGQKGQVSIKKIVEAYLERIDRNEAGLAARLYPFTRPECDERSFYNQPKVVLIDPHVSYGRPILAQTGTPTAVLADRFKAGESISDLSRDYNCPQNLIEEAIRYEQPRAA